MMTQVKSSVFLPVDDEIQLDESPRVKKRTSKTLKNAPKVMEELEESSVSNYGSGKKNKHKKLRRRKKVEPPEVSNVSLIDYYTVRGISVPSHIYKTKRKRKKKKRKKLDPDVSDDLPTVPSEEEQPEQEIPVPQVPESDTLHVLENPNNIVQQDRSSLEETFSSRAAIHRSKRKRKKCMSKSSYNNEIIRTFTHSMSKERRYVVTLNMTLLVSTEKSREIITNCKNKSVFTFQ